MQYKTWYSILGLDAEPLFLQDHMLNQHFFEQKMWETAVRKQDFLEGDKSRETGIWFVWEETGVGKQVSWLLLESGVRKQESGNRCLDSFWNQVSGNRCLVSFWKQVSGNTCLDSFWKQVSGNRCLDSLWKQVSGKQVSGFNCHWALNVRKQMSKYPMSYVLTERKCLDTGVGITLVWVTGDPHPSFMNGPSFFFI